MNYFRFVRLQRNLLIVTYPINGSQINVLVLVTCFAAAPLNYWPLFLFFVIFVSYAHFNLTGPWILAVGGSGGGAGSRNNDLISLDTVGHPVPACLKARHPFPIDVRGAVGEPVYGETGDPLVCGGVQSAGGDTWTSDQCFSYSPEANSWRQRRRMLYPRDWPGASLHPTEGLIMTGGGDR